MSDVKIKLIGPDDQILIDYSVNSGRRLPFDVCDENGNELVLVNIPERPHCVYGLGNFRSIYAYPLCEDPTPDNLVPYNSVLGAAWGISYIQSTELSHHHCTEYKKNEYTLITRNGRGFMAIPGNKNYSLNRALMMLESSIPEHPLNLNFRGYDESILNRHIEYKSEPGVIQRYYEGSAEILIKLKSSEKVVSIFDPYINYSVPKYYTTSFRVDNN